MLKWIEQSEAHLAELLPKMVTTVAVDAEENTTKAEMLMTPAANIEGGRRPAVVTSSEDQTAPVEEMLVAETASTMVEAAYMVMLVAVVAMFSMR